MPKHVLLAISEPRLILEYSLALAKDGFDVEAAASGLDCMARIRNRRPDALILDADLLWGGADGVLDVLACDFGLAATPTMVLSSGNNRRVLYQIGRFPIDDYHVKPLSARQLAALARGLVSRAESPRKTRDSVLA